MGAVHVSVRHNDNLMVAELVVIRIFTNAYAHGGNHIFDFLTGQHAVKTGTLGIQDFAAQRKNSLRIGVAPGFCGTARTVPFHNENFTFCGVLALTIGEFAGKRVFGKKSFAAHQVLCSAGCFPCSRCIDRLIDNKTCFFGVFAEKFAQGRINNALDNACYFAVAKLCLGLPFKLGLGQFNADNSCQTFAHIIAGQAFPFHFLGQIGLILNIGIDSTGQRRLKPARWVPPSTVRILLAKVCTFSL